MNAEVDIDEMYMPLAYAEGILAHYNLEATSPRINNGHIRFWETTRPYSTGFVLHVQDGMVNVVDLLDALQRRGIEPHEVVEFMETLD